MQSKMEEPDKHKQEQEGTPRANSDTHRSVQHGKSAGEKIAEGFSSGDEELQDEGQAYDRGYSSPETRRSDQRELMTTTPADEILPQGRQPSAGSDTTGSAHHAESTDKRSAKVSSGEDEEEARLVREDLVWKWISIFAALLGLLLILTAVIVAIVNPTLAIATIVSGFITVCFPVLVFLRRDASWKRLSAYRLQRCQVGCLKRIMEMPNNEKLKIYALQASMQLRNPREEK